MSKSSINSDTKTILNSIKCAISCSKDPVSTNEPIEGLEAQFGMKKINEVTIKSALDLFFAIVAAAGELGASEELYGIKQLQSLELINI